MKNPMLPGRFIGEQPQQQPPQNNENQNPQQNPQPNLFNNIIQEERVRNFISQTSPISTLERIDYILKGFIYDEGKKEWIKVSDGIPPQVRLDFLQFLTPLLSEDVRMTNLQIKQVNGVMESIIEWVVDYLDITADSGELKDENGTIYELKEEQMTKYCWIMISAVFFTLLRAQNGIENSRIFKSLNLGGSIDPPPASNQQGKKWFQFWK